MAWGKAGSTTLSTTASEVEATVSVNEFSQILNHVITAGSGNIGTRYRFNDDSGSKYAQRWSHDGGSDGTAVNQAQVFTEINDADEDRFQIGYVLSISGKEKLAINHLTETASGAGNAPQRSETVFKYIPSPDATITSVKVMETVAGSFGSGTNLTALGSDITPAAAVPAISNVQDNSLFIDKVNANRYWFTPQTVDTEQAFSFTTTDTVNALWGNRIYGMKLLSGHSGLNKYIKKIKTYHPTNPTGSRLTTGTLYHVILDSSGTEIARSAGVSASSVSNNSWAETTLSSPVKLLENYTVGVTISTGSGSSYLGTAVNNNGSSPTNTTRYYKDESGNVGLSTSETMLMIFDSDPTTGISIPATWTMQPTLEYDLSTSAGWTTTGSNCSVNTSGQYLEGSSSTNDDRATKALGLTLSDTKFVVRQKMELTTVTTGGNGQLYFGYTDKDNSTTVLGNRDAIGITIRTGADFLQSYALNQAWQSSATLSTTPTATTYYLEIIRDSATSHTINLYSDSDYSVLIETKTNTISSSINGLEYITIGGWDNSASGVITARFSDIQIYNGVNTVN